MGPRIPDAAVRAARRPRRPRSSPTGTTTYSPTLATGPMARYFFPGDHAGCTCDAAVQWEPGETGVESDGGDITLNDVGQEPVVRDADNNVVIPEGSRQPGPQYPIGQGPEG